MKVGHHPVRVRVEVRACPMVVRRCEDKSVGDSLALSSLGTRETEGSRPGPGSRSRETLFPCGQATPLTCFP